MHKKLYQIFINKKSPKWGFLKLLYVYFAELDSASRTQRIIYRTEIPAQGWNDFIHCTNSPCHSESLYKEGIF